MSTVTSSPKSVKTRPKPSLSFRLALRIGDHAGEWGCLEITETTTTCKGTKSTTYTYLVERLDSAWGVAFELRKMGGIAHFGDEDESVYHVMIANPQDHSCSCKGFQRWGHCKHHDAVRDLMGKGVLA